MKALHVYRHVPHEHLGAAAQVFLRRGVPYQYIDMFALSPKEVPPIDDAAGLLVLGGPQSVNDPPARFPTVEVELERVQQALDLELPYLGICLGSQFLAKAVGGRVFANPKGKEIGWFPVELQDEARADPLLKDLSSTQTALHWHGEIFELPYRAVALARSEMTPVQAFRWGRRAWGLLFHVELDESTLGEWLRDPSMAQEANAIGRLPAIEQGRAQRLDALVGSREAVFERFCDVLEHSSSKRA